MSGIAIKQIDKKSTRFTLMNGSLVVLIRNGDLSEELCDVIVNSTNISMNPTGGVDQSIHDKMGDFFIDQVVSLHIAMQDNACPIGQSRIFIARFQPQGNSPHFVINTAGPVYTEEEKDHATFLLKSCYQTSLALANIYQLSSIAYPAISCGAYHFPPQQAARVAIESIRQFSHNVKDVRFVLFNRDTYEIFLQEWTDYAQEINREANNTAGRSDYIHEPLKLQASARYCVLCRNEQLPNDRPLLCLNCSELPRPEIFKSVLARLRAAAESSHDKLCQECQILKPVLKSYPLVYTPIQIFDQSIHQRDYVAEYYLELHCTKEFSKCKPVAISGDGNCFYDTLAKLAATEASHVTPVELRARNVVELVINLHLYRSQYQHLFRFLDPFVEYVRKYMLHETNYTSVWDWLSIATVLDIHLISVYPKVNGEDDVHYQFLNNALFIPVIGNNDNQGQIIETSTVNKEVKVLFYNCNRPVDGVTTKKKAWAPNHFAPLLNVR